MKKKLDILKWLTPILVLLATACGHDDLVSPDDSQEKESKPYVELRIAMPAGRSLSSRAYPTGGEDGDGRERGILKEDLIHDVNVFFYVEEVKDGIGLGLNSDGYKTRIIKHIYYNLDDSNDPYNTKLTSGERQEHNLGLVDEEEDYKPYFENDYLVLRFDCTPEEINEIENKGINFVTIANVGYLQNKQTLGDVRGYNLSADKTGTWTRKYDEFSKDASKMDYFLMTTAYNDNCKYGGQMTGTNKITKNGSEYTGFTTLQRMYARLDLWYNENVNAVKVGEGEATKVTQLKYAVEGAPANTVFLTNALPVNVMQTPSYLFKKVTNDPLRHWSLSYTSAWNYGGLSEVENFSWGGRESIDDSESSVPDNYVMEPHTLEKTPGGEGGDYGQWFGSTAKSKVIENLQKDLTNSDNNVDNGKLSAYYHGVTSDENGFGCDQVSILAYANENTHPTDCFHSNYLTGMAFRAVYVPSEIYGGVEETKETIGEEEKTVWKPTVMEAEVKPSKIYRYSPSAENEVDESKSLYFSSKEVAEEYAKKHLEDSALITEFDATLHEGKWGIVCYYNLWLRHYNNENADPELSYPMEYATVRNNIYRVKVSFRGPGDPTPTMREPDTMQARIFVRKWNYKEESQIIF